MKKRIVLLFFAVMLTTICMLSFFGCDEEAPLEKDASDNEASYTEYDNAYYLAEGSNPYHTLVKAKNTSITECEIHKDTKKISKNAFEDCKLLRTITLHEGLEEIGSLAFSNCIALKEVTIPKSVKVLGSRVFYYCPVVIGVYYPNDESFPQGWNEEALWYTSMGSDIVFVGEEE